MEHLLSAWPQIAQQITAARRILLLTDYDGTLTPIVDKPEMANISENMRQTLKALSRQHRLILGIISGRALADLKNKVNIKSIIYAGNHGLEVEGPGISFVNPIAEEIRPFLRVIYFVLGKALEVVKGAWVEDKGLTLSVHYRQVEPSRTQDVKNVFEKVVGGIQAWGKVKITSGKKVYELRPAVDWDKGKVIKYIMKKYGRGGRQSGLLPIYLGDDLTDEDGFKVIEKYGIGITVFIGIPNQKTQARYYLKNPAEVNDFMNTLLNYARRGYR